MPFNSRAYRILIGSPSDVEEERDIAVRVIQEWNDLYSYSRGVVLLPLRWETHSAPEYGTRPQEVINRAVVDQADLLVGIFWTRVGTPTGAADSGTLEEIARVAKAGKPIMLYFSRVGMDPDRIDLDQLNKLKAFKAETYPNALTESYKSHIEFRDKFAKQLELKVRELQKADTAGGPPPLVLSIAAEDLKTLEGAPTRRSVEVIDVVDLDSSLGPNSKANEQLRMAVQTYVERAATTPTVLAISNTGSSGIRNLYVEMEVTASAHVIVTDQEPRHHRYLWSRTFEQLILWSDERDVASVADWKAPDVSWETGPDLREGFTKTDNGWRLTFEWPALQPKRLRLVSPALFVTARAEGSVKFVAKVFADSLPEPVTLDASLDISVRRRQVQVSDLVGNTAVIEAK